MNFCWGRSYITAPTCHGTNSFCPYPCSSLLLLALDAVASTNSKMRSSISATVLLTSMISTQLRSMLASYLRRSAELVDSLSEGAQP